MKVENNYIKKTGKFTDMWRFKNMVLKNLQDKREIKKNTSRHMIVEI